MVWYFVKHGDNFIINK